MRDSPGTVGTAWGVQGAHLVGARLAGARVNAATGLAVGVRLAGRRARLVAVCQA
jgi:hypothetical protein